MKKLLSLSLILSLGLATVTPALNAVAQSQSVVQSQANPANASGWQAAKKWWRSGRNMKALNAQEQRAFRDLRTKFAIGTIIAAIIAIVGGGAAYLHRKSAGGTADVFAGPSGVAVQPKQIGFAVRATGPVETPAARGSLEWELIDAARIGDKAKVKELIAIGGVNLNATFGGWTALMYAAAQGYKNNIVRLLLDAGADKEMRTPRGATAEDLARGSNSVLADMIRDYGSQRADVVDVWLPDEPVSRATEPVVAGHLGQELIDAAREGDENRVKDLLKREADVNATNQERETALIWAARNGHENIVERLLQVEGIDVNAKTEWGNTALIHAAIQNHENIVERLLQVDGIDVNASNIFRNSALTWASEDGYENIVKMLLQVDGIDVNATDRGEHTALMHAARKGHENIVKMLLQVEGIDVNAALMRAAIIRGRENIVERLLEAGADVNVQNDHGRTTLMEAAFRGHENIVERLLPRADRTKQDIDGQTAESLARSRGHENLANMIRDYGSGRSIKSAGKKGKKEREDK